MDNPHETLREAHVRRPSPVPQSSFTQEQKSGQFYLLLTGSFTFFGSALSSWFRWPLLAAEPYPDPVHEADRCQVPFHTSTRPDHVAGRGAHDISAERKHI
jgi:hypothetical protein